MKLKIVKEFQNHAAHASNNSNTYVIQWKIVQLYTGTNKKSIEYNEWIQLTLLSKSLQYQ